MPEMEKAGAAKETVLDPVHRLSEILFGLIMVLTFTGSLSVATSDRAEVRTVLIGAIGCNLAWGLIDAVMYLMASLHERGEDRRTFAAVKAAGSSEEAHSVIREKVPRAVAEELHHEVLERIRMRILRSPGAGTGRWLRGDELRGALAVFLIVVASTFPVIAPFMVLEDLPLAMRLSNAIAVGMLALIGFAYGRVSGLSPWWTSLAMVLLGCVLVAVTIALGG
ncbi:VIT1/CCC1 transporter family protein [Aestuariivirga sp.]|uniref:VIT1/CCC1 transporter family protein n=1 Tax=Aestuariivirga sp. TaxID=2650926 RepID=UPI00391ADCB2